MKLTVTNLSKQYSRDFWELKDFSLEIKPGILGLLGLNGAGKSIFMRMLATITKPTDGTITWNGTDVITEEFLSGWLARLMKFSDAQFLEKSLEGSLKILKAKTAANEPE
jgi:ABC-type multidrug transport system ATPase subunit